MVLPTSTASRPPRWRRLTRAGIPALATVGVVAWLWLARGGPDATDAGIARRALAAGRLDEAAAALDRRPAHRPDRRSLTSSRPRSPGASRPGAVHDELEQARALVPPRRIWTDPGACSWPPPTRPPRPSPSCAGHSTTTKGPTPSCAGPGADLPGFLPTLRGRRGPGPLGQGGPRRRPSLPDADRDRDADRTRSRGGDLVVSRGAPPRSRPRPGPVRAGRDAPDQPPQRRGGGRIRHLPGP